MDRKLEEVKNRLEDALRYHDQFEDSEDAVVQKVREVLSIIG